MNAIRSPMAAGMMRHFYGSKVFVASCGVRAGEADGFAIAVMEEIDISIAKHRPQSFDDLTDTSFDLVISLSPEAHHRAPENDLVEPYAPDAPLATRLHAITLVGGEYQTHDYYMTVGPQFTDPVARQLYAEIASVESQHITHYGSMLNPDETPLEKLVLQQAAEVWNYQACAQQENEPRLRALWERFLDYELGHLQVAIGLLQDIERRDASQVLGDGRTPAGIAFRSQREFVRQVLADEVGLRKDGTRFVPEEAESVRSLAWRNHMNAQGSPSQTVSAGYQWTPGGELNASLARGAGTTATV